MAFPKNYVSVQDEIRRIRSHFGSKLDGPCFIVGNGPSSCEPKISKEELKTATIFRANWFFLETEKTYGNRVDGFFWSVDNKGLRESISEVQRLGQYQIGSFFQPFTASDIRSEVVTKEAPDMTPNFDHWAVIASDPTLARYMMSRPLPTQGMQMIAFAAILGFKNIHVSGIDLYEQTATRYAWDVPDHVKLHLKAKDWEAGYEQKHSLDLDIHFLRAIRSNHQFDLIGISQMNRLAPYLDRSETKAAPPAKRQIPKWAFVTLADGRYSIGAVALARSLAKVSDVPLIVLHSDPHTPGALHHLKNVEMRRVEPINNPHGHGQQRFQGTFTKLRIFDMLELDRIIFIDADCIVQQPIDHLFETEGILAAPDWGGDLTMDFNSGVFVFSPSDELRGRVFSGMHQIHSNDGGDQGLLNKLFRDEITLLPPEYNMLKRLPVKHPNLIAVNDAKIIHFVGDKPWDIHVRRDEYTTLEQMWAEHLEVKDWQLLFWMSKTFVSKRWERATASSGDQKKKTPPISTAPVTYEQRLKSYGPAKRLVVRAGDAIFPERLSKPIYVALKRRGIL